MTLFVFWMLLASAMGFVKLLSLAYVMPVYEYGQYAAFFGVATFSSMLLSFGLTEKTIKDYPRHWVSGRRTAVLVDAVRIGRILIFRCICVGAVAVAISLLGLIDVKPIAVILVTMLAICTVLLTIVGSLYRAAGSQKATQDFTFWRSILVMVFSISLGAFSGWKGAIAGDIVGNLLGIFFAMWQVPQIYKDESINKISDRNINVADKGHYKIYLANLAVAPQSMLDKGWVSGAIGPALAGSYGIVMLIPLAVQLLGNVVVQYIGPLVIKLVHLKDVGLNRQSTIAFNAMLLAIFSFALTVSGLIAKRLPYLNHLFDKYAISDISLLMVGIIACSQIYGLIEFHLIAHNREREVLVASLVSSLVFLLSFSGAAEVQASIEWFLAGVGAARWCQVWLLVRAYRRYA